MDTQSKPNAESATPLSLLVRVRAHDAQGWCRLVELYGPLVRSWCSRGRVPSGDVDDVVQEVFAAAAVGLATFRHDRPGDTFRGWLRAIARNQVAFYFRHNHDRPRAAGGSEAWQRLQDLPDPLSRLEEDEPSDVQQLYLRALDQVRGGFEERTWRAFWLTAIDGRSPVDVGRELGMAPASIRQAKCRVLRRLKDELGELLG